MSQTTIDFSGDPSGVQLLDNLLTPMLANILSQNSGTSRPSYAAAGTSWINTTTNPWVVNVYDGSSDVVIGYINTSTHAFASTGGYLDNVAGTVAPTVNEDSADGYTVGSRWMDTTADKAYVCLDSTVGAAVWKLISLTAAEVLAGGTFTGKITTVASATGGAGLNLPHGAAPTSPTNGDFWSTTSAFFARINSVTHQLLTLAGGTLTGKLNTLASATGGAGLNLPHGAAPTSPVDGDVWTTSAGTFVRINGVTVALGASAGVVVTTLSKSNQSSADIALDFATYHTYIISFNKLRPATDAQNIYLKLSDDAVINYDAPTNHRAFDLDGGGPHYFSAGEITGAAGNSAGNQGCGIIEITQPLTSSDVFVKHHSIYKNTGGTALGHEGVMNFAYTVAATNARIISASGNMYGEFVIQAFKR